MIPLLSIPVINRPDLLGRCIASIDHPVERLVVIDNSPTWEMATVVDNTVPPCVGSWMTATMPGNLGVAASWNLAIKTAPGLPWWCIANADTQFGPGDLERLAAEMDQGGARWVGVNGDWRVFGLSFAVVQAVGLFDENFHPIYCEDADYEYRCTLAGVPWRFIAGTSTHVGSAAIRSDARYDHANRSRSHPSNMRYYEAKWGGHLRGGERFTTPFDRGGPVSEWTLDIRRIRDNAWETR